MNLFAAIINAAASVLAVLALCDGQNDKALLFIALSFLSFCVFLLVEGE